MIRLVKRIKGDLMGVAGWGGDRLLLSARWSGQAALQGCQ